MSIKLKILAKDLWTYDELMIAISNKDNWRLPTFEEIEELYYQQDFDNIGFFVQGDIQEIDYGGKLVPYVSIKKDIFTRGTINAGIKLKGAVIKTLG